MRIRLISIDFLDRHLDSIPKDCVQLRVENPIDSDLIESIGFSKLKLLINPIRI